MVDDQLVKSILWIELLYSKKKKIKCKTTLPHLKSSPSST